VSTIALAAKAADERPQQCGKIASVLVITDTFYPELEGMPVCRLAPTAHNFFSHTWWHFSTQFFTQFLAVIGVTNSETFRRHRGNPYTLFTVVGRQE
jgi:hypothetical protein